MTRLLGIDASKSTVRTAIVRTSYRRLVLESLGEADVGWAGSEVEAIRVAAGGVKPDACAVALPGDRSFYRRLEVPAAAQRELENVLAFELEASVPFEMDEAVFDHRTLRGGPNPTKITVFAVLGRTEDVRARIAMVREAIGLEPERVGSGPLPLVNLLAVMPELERGPGMAGPIAILDVGETTSELLVIVGGEPVFARTLSRGTIGLPASAHNLAKDLRQSVGSWRSQGGAQLAAVYLSGVGAAAEGATAFLTAELGIPILPLPPSRFEGITPEQAAQLPRFAKAIGLALGLTGRAKAHNLRRGALEAERSYPYLREKIPVLSGLAAVIAVSFGFSTIAEVRSLDAEREMLGARLALATRDVLGEEITEPEKAREVLESGPGKADEDPLPRIDAFDVMVQLSKAVPPSLVHDVVELDVQRGKAVVQGVVPAIADSDTVAKGMRENHCFKDVRVRSTTQFAEGKYKYQLEFELKCEPPRKAKSSAEPDASAQPAAGASAKPDKADKADKADKDKPDKPDKHEPESGNKTDGGT
jgi:general secretion pathway protein L